MLGFFVVVVVIIIVAVIVGYIEFDRSILLRFFGLLRERASKCCCLQLRFKRTTENCACERNCIRARIHSTEISARSFVRWFVRSTTLTIACYVGLYTMYLYMTYFNC